MLKILSKSILIFLVFSVVIVIVQGGWTLLGFILTQDPASAEQLFLERMYPITAAIIFIFWAKEKYYELYAEILSGIKLTKQQVFIFAKITVLSLTLLYGTFLISGLFQQYEFIHFGTEEFPFLTILKQFLLVGFIGNLIAVIGEEIMFRGFFMSYIIKMSKNKLFGLIFSSFVFCLHPYLDFLNFVIAFCAGIVIGYAYLKFKTLYIPIGIHFAYNLFNFTIASEPGRGPQLPYIIKFEYSMIFERLGAWVDLFIILGFLLIFIVLWQGFNFLKNDSLAARTAK